MTRPRSILDGSAWADRWVLGGGTGLALLLDHRESDDIDLFFTDARALRDFTPNLNPSSARRGSTRATT